MIWFPTVQLPFRYPHLHHAHGTSKTAWPRISFERFLFNVLINGLATDIKRACNDVTCPGNAEGVRVHVLLYADDLIILSDNPADLKCALHAAHAWARSWRFHFAVGPQKTASCALDLVGCVAPGPDSGWATNGCQL